MSDESERIMTMTEFRLAAPDRFISQRELAALFGVSEHTPRTWRVGGNGPPYYSVGGQIRYQVSEVRDWLEANHHHPSTEDGENA